MLKAGRSRVWASVVTFCLGGLAVVVDDAVLRTEELAAEEAETWRCCFGSRVVTVLARPSGRLLGAIAVAAGLDAGAFNSREGGRWGRSVVFGFEEVAVDLARVCAVVRGDCSLEVGAGAVDRLGDGREVGEVDNGSTRDLGLVALGV